MDAVPERSKTIARSEFPRKQEPSESAFERVADPEVNETLQHPGSSHDREAA